LEGVGGLDAAPVAGPSPAPILVPIPLPPKGGAFAHEANIPTISTLQPLRRSHVMGLLLLEALGAMVLLIAIVWWTMFSGRKNGEPTTPPEGENKHK
jgi:hypothetical protein